MTLRESRPLAEPLAKTIDDLRRPLVSPQVPPQNTLHPKVFNLDTLYLVFKDRFFTSLFPEVSSQSSISCPLENRNYTLDSSVCQAACNMGAGRTYQKLYLADESGLKQIHKHYLKL